MSDWLHNLPIVWMALVDFGFTYLGLQESAGSSRPSRRASEPVHSRQFPREC